MQIVPRVLHFERCSIVFTVKGDMQITVDPVSPRTLSKTSARRAKQIDLPCSPSVAKRKTPFPLTNEHAASPCSFFSSEMLIPLVPL